MQDKQKHLEQSQQAISEKDLEIEHIGQKLKTIQDELDRATLTKSFVDVVKEAPDVSSSITTATIVEGNLTDSVMSSNEYEIVKSIKEKQQEQEEEPEHGEEEHEEESTNAAASTTQETSANSTHKKKKHHKRR